MKKHCDNILFVYHSVSNVLTVLTILTGTNDYSLYYREWTGDEVTLNVCACQIGRHSRLSEWILRFQFTRRKRSNCFNYINFYSLYYRTNERETKWYWEREPTNLAGIHDTEKIWTKNITNILTYELHRNDYKANERDMKWYRVGCLIKSGHTLSLMLSRKEWDLYDWTQMNCEICGMP